MILLMGVALLAKVLPETWLCRGRIWLIRQSWQKNLVASIRSCSAEGFPGILVAFLANPPECYSLNEMVPGNPGAIRASKLL